MLQDFVSYKSRFPKSRGINLHEKAANHVQPMPMHMGKRQNYVKPMPMQRKLARKTLISAIFLSLQTFP